MLLIWKMQASLTGGSAIFHLNMYVTLEEDQLKITYTYRRNNGGKWWKDTDFIFT